MTGQEFRTVMSFESGLKIGDPVTVNWTNCGYYFQGQGTVAKINRKSLRVRLTEKVPCCYSEPYAIGREIIIPRIENILGWSVNNRVEPRGGYQPVKETNHA